ncbi:AbfB domain-containing protein [Streptomyces sp. NPDC020362]|uniref:AbfB domain-containing protein n=1 Tax=unclassified Streptomyces TaxID=2593676 RepID=UPI0034107916
METARRSAPRPPSDSTDVRPLGVTSATRFAHDPVASPSDRRAATFTLVKGLSDARCYSFATADGGYLRHQNSRLQLDPYRNTGLYRADSAFLLVDASS